MGVQNLQNFLEAGHVEGGAVPVELLKIARTFQRPNKQNRNKPNNKKLSLVLDAECCLDRLYGGFFSDWTCGGQWNRMFQYLSQFIKSCQNGNIELTVAFNGALETQRFSEWTQKQMKDKSKANSVLRHIHNKGTPPPKVWWIPPVGLTTALRMALRYYNITVMCSMDDHHQEVLAYCRENNLHGIVGDDAEYIVFDPPRYFSASNLKLTYKGSIETKEFLIEELAKGLELTTERLCILAALLGNYLLSESQLTQLHTKIGVYPSKNPLDVTIHGVAKYVKTLENIDNLDALATQIFGSLSDKNEKKKQGFIQSVQYYLNGTKSGFLKYKPRKSHKANQKNQATRKESAENKKKEPLSNVEANESSEQNLDSSKFASETIESEAGSLAAYKLATEQQTKYAPQIVIDEGEEVKGQKQSGESLINGEKSAVNGSIPPSLLLSSSSSSSSSEIPSPSKTPETSGKGGSGDHGTDRAAKFPPASPEVLRTACERHQKGLMSPHIYHILTQGEIKLPILLEEEGNKEISNINIIYRPIRQNVYAILFNLHHQLYIANKDKEKEREDGDSQDKQSAPPPEIRIHEWVWTSMNQYHLPDVVKAEPIGWPVPTIQRLWFGTSIDDMRRRLRAYLTCLKSDSPLMVCASYVPQHLLIMASVLRYLMQCKPAILRKCELDAFVVTAFSPDLMNTEYTQDLQLQGVTARGIQLATLFMQGVETALLVNDACGAPIPWLMCCPWLFFDGKLFHYILAKTEHVKSLQELCNHRLEILLKVERMRHAILENLIVQFARRPLPAMATGNYPISIPTLAPAGYNSGLDQVRRGPPRRPLSTRGGQLEVAGVVVGSWGANYALTRNRFSNQLPGAAGLRNYGRPGYQNDRLGYPTYTRTRGLGRGMQRKRPGTGNNKKIKGKKNEKKKESRGRGITDENSKVDTVGDTLQSSNSEENGEQYEDAILLDDGNLSSIENKMAAVTLERGQGDHAID